MNTNVIKPTVEQVDLFGEATSKRNNADKVRNAVYPLFKLAYENYDIGTFEGTRWIVKATTSSRNGLDVHRLIETLGKMGVPNPATLVDSCYEKTSYPTFRSTEIAVLS